MDNWSAFDKVILLASSSGNWHNFKPSLRRKVKLSTNLFFPISLSLLGYVPGRFGLGQDWPKGVAKEWWQNSKDNQLMAESMKQWVGKTEYDRINKDIHAIFSSDDPMATPYTLPNIARSYPSANVKNQYISSGEFGLKEIGYFGIFKSYNQETLGSVVIDLLEP
ncbi:MAG: putative alpha/beta hydrolase [Saprospiraceae bacterium]|jgi:predicted alpha/beta hydrolase